MRGHGEQENLVERGDTGHTTGQSHWDESTQLWKFRDPCLWRRAGGSRMKM